MSAAAPLLYFLIALTSGNAPSMATLGSFPDAESCRAAAGAVTSALAGASDGSQVGCYSLDALMSFNQARLQ